MLSEIQVPSLNFEKLITVINVTINMKKLNKYKILQEIEIEVDKNFPLLMELAKNDCVRNPLTDYLIVTYPPRSICKPLSLQERIKVTDKIFQKIKQASRDTKISIYIHTSFCTRRCTFCHYFGLRGNIWEKELQNYVDHIKREIKLVGKKLNKRKIIHSVFFGGGSPSLFTERQVADILETLKEYFIFSDDMEITLEIHPEIIRMKNAQEYFKGLKKIGVTRLNVGLQSASDDILKMTNRGHTVEEAIMVYKIAKTYGFVLNIDLIWGGLILDNTNSFYESLKLAFSLEPDTVTTYHMWIRPDSPDYLRYQNKPYLFPNWYEIVKERFLTYKMAKIFGYKEEFIDWFRKKKGKGYQQQKEKWATDKTILLPFGPGTYGWVFTDYNENYMYWHVHDYSEYINLIESEQIPLERMYELDKKQTILRHIIFRLKSGKILTKDLDRWLEEFPEIEKEIKDMFQSLENLGLLKINTKMIELTKLGCWIADEIASVFTPEEIISKMEDVKDEKEKRYEWYVDPRMIRNFQKFIVDYKKRSDT